MIGPKSYMKIMRACLKEINAFYYLVHPADLACKDDLDPSRKIHLERFDRTLDEKMALFERSICEILENGRKIVTMQELADRCLNVDFDQ